MPKRSKTRDRGWRDWYQRECWRKRAKHQLRIEPLCRFCLAKGRVRAAVCADHIEPHHRRDWNAFRLGALQSLCFECHNTDKRYIERHGSPKPVYGLDGWPVDGG